MRRQQNRPSLTTHLGDQVHDDGPRLGVDAAEGLVEEQHIPFLRQRPGQKHSLSLPARELADLTLPQRSDAELIQCDARDAPIVPPGAAEKTPSTLAAEHHRFLHRDREGPVDLIRLWGVGDASALLSVDRHAVERD